MEYVIFDLDGTLVDSLPDITLATNQALKLLELPMVDTNIVHDTIGYGLSHTVRTLLPDDTAEDMVHKAISVAFNFYHEKPVRESVVFDGVMDMLYSLQEKGTYLAILSNKNQVLVDGVVAHFFSDITWKCVIGVDKEEYKKPSIHYLDQLLSSSATSYLKNNVQKDEVLKHAHMVGDNNADAIFAINANIAFIGAGWGYYSVNIAEQKFSSFNIATNPHNLLLLV